MEVVSYVTEVSGRKDTFSLVPIYDVHLGTKNCDETKFQETIDWIARNKNVYWFGGGDLCEFINVSDPRFEPSSLAPRFLEHLDDLALAQCNDILRTLKPIKNRCIGLLEGNHENKIREKYHFSPTDYMAGVLGTKNLLYTALIRWTFRRDKKSGKNVIIYASHGYGGGLSETACLNRLIGQAGKFEADIYLCGHSHKKIFKDMDRLEVSISGEPRLIEKKQVFGVGGTFYKTYEQGTRSYGEKSGYAPTPTGVLKIRIEPFNYTHINGHGVELPPHIHISG